MRYLLSLILIITISLSSYGDLIPTIVKIYDESEIDELLELGVSIERRRENLLLCYFPGSDEETVVIPNQDRKNETYTRSSKEGKKSSNKTYSILQKKQGLLNRPTLDEAVKFFEAVNIQEGKGFSSPYTGKGVVVGLCDIGFDPLHPTFLDEEGKSRVKQITQYKEFSGERLVICGDDAYREWQTDSVDKYHATHVAGILAGRGAGTSYKGIAYDSEIVASMSCLTDFGLLMGVEDIIDYAKEVGKPAVINLSMGKYVGAHDGSSLFSQYLDLCADDAIIVLSAGNEGNHTNTLRHRLNSTQPLEFRLGNRAWDQKVMYGMTDIWNSGPTPLKVTVCLYDDETHTIAYEYEPLELENWESVNYEWNPDSPMLSGWTLDGYLTVIGGVDPENGRYEVTLFYDYTSSRLIGSGWAKDMVSVKIEGEEGDIVEIYADGSYSRLMGISGQPIPDSSLSISDLTCGFRVISVGMYGNREYYPVTKFNENGEPLNTEFISTGRTSLGTVVNSSYGTLSDGRNMPLTVGPGDPVMSACSRYYRDANPEDEYYMDDSGVLWYSSGGTSMSAPYVAGYIATWLEALPELTVEDVMEMIAASNRLDIAEPNNPRNINGYFNPVGALKHAIYKNGITQIKDPTYLLAPTDSIEVFTLSGIKVFSGLAEGMSSLKKGIYIIKTPFGVIKKVV